MSFQLKHFGTIIKSNRENRRNYYNIFRNVEGHLLGGKQVLSGNNKPHSNHKTKRKWFPNVTKKSLFSEIMGRSYLLTVSMAALRTIDKKGGLDNYLLQTSDANLKSQWGSEMKSTLAAKLKERKEKESSDIPSK